MSKPIRAMPGPGGSLGECGVCGKSFAYEVIVGESVKVVGHEGLTHDFPIHAACEEILQKVHMSQDWHDLPSGLLRTVFKDQEKSRESSI